MFGFGTSREGSRHDDIFEVADVRELVQTFPNKLSLDEGQKSDPKELIPLASGEGFVVRSAISRSLQEELGKKDGRVAVVSLAVELDVTPKDLLRLIDDDENTFLSTDGKSVLTRQELKSIIQELQRKTEESFVPATVFAEQWNIDRKDLVKLLEISDEEIREGPLQLLQDPRVSSVSSESASYPYIHTLSVLLKTKENLTGKINSAQDEAK
jgi:hypothetical protein